MSDLSDKNKLNCGGQPCLICGACRDWYFDRDNGIMVKRDGTDCIHQSIFDHKIGNNSKDENCYPMGLLICECTDNH
jgi:hypothetical protein